MMKQVIDLTQSSYLLEWAALPLSEKNKQTMYDN